MRMKMVCDDRTLREVANEFLALKKAQKIRERTLSDYKKYIDKFLAQSQNTLDVDVLKIEILEYFADIPKTSPARFNHPYQYLHALFEWCAKQDYLPYNPFQKLQLKKVRDEGNVQPAEIKDIQTLLKALDKHNYTELRDYNIVLLIRLLQNKIRHGIYLFQLIETIPRFFPGCDHFKVFVDIIYRDFQNFIVGRLVQNYVIIIRVFQLSMQVSVFPPDRHVVQP